MLKILPVKGRIAATLIQFEGTDREDRQSASFTSGFQIPQLRFSENETFKFFLRIKEEEGRNELTKAWEIVRRGELSFNVFLPGDERSYRNGSETFFLHPVQREQKFEWGNIAIKRLLVGRVGFISVDLSFILL